MNNKRIIKKKLSASIITISQLNRFECLKNLFELIKLQTYDNIIEWVIVEGSKIKEDADKNKLNVDLLVSKKIKIIYLEFTGKKLSDLRNLGNNKCSGDIIVCMDDDDYYPITRVSHAVESLENNSALIAGCSDIYLYEYILDKLYKFNGFHVKHSTNNCFAFKREYLRNHKHESGLDMAEEKSFTNNFTEQMVQLKSEKCIIVSSHNHNTFNKRELCVGGSYGLNPSLYEVTNHPITSYMPIEIFNNFKKLFYQEESSEYDIVYFTGAFCTAWSPNNKSLGGSEQAIVYLCEAWAKKGLKVCVFTELENNKELIKNQVEYKNWKSFPFNHLFKTVILWRHNGFFSGIPFNIKAINIYWDLHDNFSDDDKIVNLYLKYSNRVTKILLKSNYHLEAFNKFFKTKLNNSQYEIISNGVVLDKFLLNTENVKRNPYRFCYVSYYTRGLFHIIPYIFNIMKQIEPRVELHLYYGMDMFNDENLKTELKKLTCQPGVIDHGRQNIELIIREKYMSTFQLYITNTISEIDCISIKESLVTGCIPLISNFGVFKEREGIHFELNEQDINSMKDIAINIINFAKNHKQVEILSNCLKKSNTILDWTTIANKIENIT
jgi:hypothetical protein